MLNPDSGTVVSRTSRASSMSLKIRWAALDHPVADEGGPGGDHGEVERGEDRRSAKGRLAEDLARPSFREGFQDTRVAAHGFSPLVIRISKGLHPPIPVSQPVGVG